MPGTARLCIFRATCEPSTAFFGKHLLKPMSHPLRQVCARFLIFYPYINAHLRSMTPPKFPTQACSSVNVTKVICRYDLRVRAIGWRVGLKRWKKKRGNQISSPDMAWRDMNRGETDKSSPHFFVCPLYHPLICRDSGAALRRYPRWELKWRH